MLVDERERRVCRVFELSVAEADLGREGGMEEEIPGWIQKDSCTEMGEGIFLYILSDI